jgi:hypothetical protein
VLQGLHALRKSIENEWFDETLPERKAGGSGRTLCCQLPGSSVVACVLEVVSSVVVAEGEGLCLRAWARQKPRS